MVPIVVSAALNAGPVVDPMDFNASKSFPDSRKKQEQDLKKALSSRMEANLAEVVHDTDNGVDDAEWEEGE